MIWWETISVTLDQIFKVNAQTPKIRSKWWYLLPIFLGVIGGTIAWISLKSYDRKLAKNCLILGITLDVIEIIIFVGLTISSDIFNLVTEFGTISETSDFNIQFKIGVP
jgi:hypothetical protein